MSLAARLATGVVLVGGALVVSTQAGAAGPATSVQTVSPLDANGALKAAYKVTRQIGHGVCQTGSYQVGNAYRCTSPAAGSVTLDPCWPLLTAASTMVCQQKPWAPQVVELHEIGRADGGPNAKPAPLPWGLRIGAKIRCLRDVGAVFVLDGHLLLYHCSQHRDVLGPLQSRGGSLRAHLYRNDAHTRSGEKSVGWRQVAIAWRGAAPVTSPSPSPTPTPTDTATPTPAPTDTPTATASTTPTM